MHGADRRKHCTETLRPHFSSIILLLFLLTDSIFQSDSAQAALVLWSSNSSGTADSFTWHNGGSDKSLFDNPTLVDGHILRFSFDDDFTAYSSEGKSAIKSDRLQVDIFADIDTVIQGIKITEYGSFDINTVGKVSASATIFITNMSQYEVRSAMVSMTPSMPISATGNGPWSGEVIIDGLNWTHLRIVLNNNLIATSKSGSHTSIEKTAFDLEIIVPEPATVAVLTLGGLILPLFGKKKKYD